MVGQSNGYSDIIIFYNKILLYQAQKKAEKCFSYNIKQWKITGTFYIINDISEYLTLIQFIFMVVNVNHTVIITRNWIFDSKYDREPPVDK